MAPGTRNKFGAPAFEPDVFRKQMYCIEESTCDIVRTFRPPGNCGPPHYASGSQIVCIHPYSLNTTTAFDFATECSDVAMFIWGHVALRQWCSRDCNPFETETWLKFWDEADTSSKSPRLETWNSRPRLETSKFVHFAEIFFLMSLLLTWIFFKFLACFRRVLIVSYLQIQQTKNCWIIEILINHFFAIFKVSRPETFQTETRKNGSRDQD